MGTHVYNAVMINKKDSSQVNRFEETPLYVQAEEKIYDVIRRNNLKVGDAIPGRAILCKEFDVSDLTVRKAIGHLVRRGVLVSRQGRGTFLASSEKFRKIFFVCGLDTFSSDVSPFYTHFLSSCRKEAHRLGWELEPVFLSDERHEESIRYCNSNSLRGYEGFIFVGCSLSHPLLRYIESNRLKYVLTTHEQAGPKRVTSDFHGSIEKSVEYLRQIGHEEILIVCNSDVLESVRDSSKNFGRAIRILETTALPRAAECEADGYHLLQSLLSEGKLPSAIIFLDDIVARGASRLVLQAGQSIKTKPDWVVFSGLTEIVPLGFPVAYAVVDTCKKAKEAVRIVVDQIENRSGNPDSYHEVPRMILPGEPLSTQEQPARTNKYTIHSLSAKAGKYECVDYMKINA